VLPFILRGVNLLGINSVTVPREPRRDAWARLASTLKPAVFASVTRTIGLTELPASAKEILAGHVRGRTVVDLSR
jgi:acrylyl-CoA reductase (NADPH)